MWQNWGVVILFFFFFKQKTAYEIVSRDWSSDVCSSDLPISRCGSARAFYTYKFSLRQLLRFLNCQFLVAAAPQLFILTNSRCGSALTFYTAHSSLRQRLRFLYLPILVAAAPALFILTNSRCGSAPLFILPGSRCGRAPTFFTDYFSLRQRPHFL